MKTEEMWLIVMVLIVNMIPVTTAKTIAIIKSCPTLVLLPPTVDEKAIMITHAMISRPPAMSKSVSFFP